MARYVVFTREGACFEVRAQDVEEAKSLAELFCSCVGLKLHSILEVKPKERDGRG